MRILHLFLLTFFMGCSAMWHVPADFIPIKIDGEKYDVFTYQRISDNYSPIHIYIEGDGNSFDAYGMPTNNPTPRGTFVRELAASDDAKNVVYMARPCQFIKNKNCTISDWTDGRFSADIVKATADAIRQVAENRPIILIGYSGGAMLSGLVIEKNSDLNIVKWITIAGVLNHTDWTEYFGDTPLHSSQNLNELPHISQEHYVAEHDTIVPRTLSEKWVGSDNIIIVPNSTHNKFPNLKIVF